MIFISVTALLLVKISQNLIRLEYFHPNDIYDIQTQFNLGCHDNICHIFKFVYFTAFFKIGKKLIGKLSSNLNSLSTLQVHKYIILESF